MYKYLLGILSILVFVGAGCSVDLDTTGKNLNNVESDNNTNTEEVIDLSVDETTASQNDNKSPNTTNNEIPQITSASFDGNGVIIQGKNLSGSFVSFITPSSKVPCREMITSSCVLQKTVSTDVSIKFNSNLIGEKGTYQIYVENSSTGMSNKINFSIPKTSTSGELSKEAMEAELKAFFEKEKGKSVEKLQVILQDGAFVRGEVSFEPGYGGIFFVVKQNGAWKIAYEGNGTISCSLKTEYGFPSTFLNDCAN